MAANRQQGSYLAVFLIAFTVLPAGLLAWSSHPIIGVILTLSGIALMIHALIAASSAVPGRVDCFFAQWPTIGGDGEARITGLVH